MPRKQLQRKNEHKQPKKRKKNMCLNTKQPLNHLTTKTHALTSEPRDLSCHFKFRIDRRHHQQQRRPRPRDLSTYSCLVGGRGGGGTNSERGNKLTPLCSSWPWSWRAQMTCHILCCLELECLLIGGSNPLISTTPPGPCLFVPFTGHPRAQSREPRRRCSRRCARSPRHRSGGEA